MTISIRTQRNFQGLYDADLVFTDGFGNTAKRIVWGASTSIQAYKQAKEMLEGAILDPAALHNVLASLGDLEEPNNELALVEADLENE